jgi:2-phosphosulfolactate phosphatase
LLAGEVNGYPIEGFDLPNSPSVIANLDLSNQRLVLRTTAGSQGAVLATHAKDLYVASLGVATPTACSINELSPKNVTFVETGLRTKGGGEEDIACADYIASLLLKAPLDTTEIQNRVLNSRAAIKFTEPDEGNFPESDLKHALKIDRFNFAMKASRIDNRLVLKITDGI